MAYLKKIYSLFETIQISTYHRVGRILDYFSCKWTILCLPSKAKDLALEIYNHSKDISKLDLSSHDLSRYETIELVLAFSVTPNHVKSLILSNTKIFSDDHRITLPLEVLSAIPSNVINIIFAGGSWVSLILLNGRFLKNVFSGLHRELKYLDLSSAQLHRFEDSYLIEGFLELPQLTSLNLSNNDLVVSVFSLCAFLPRSIKNLNLSKTVSYYSHDDRENYQFEKFKMPEVEYLNLSYNHLRDDAIKILKWLPLSIIHLNLSGNEFGLMPQEKIIELFSAFLPNIKNIILAKNSFKSKTPEEITEIMAAIPLTVINVDISGNGFDLNSEKLEEIQKYVAKNDPNTLHGFKLNAAFSKEWLFSFSKSKLTRP